MSKYDIRTYIRNRHITYDRRDFILLYLNMNRCQVEPVKNNIEIETNENELKTRSL